MIGPAAKGLKARTDWVAGVGLLAGPLALVVVLLVAPPAGLPVGAWSTLGVTIWIAVWWATEPIPIPVTSLLPLVLLPALGLLGLDEAAAPYANPIVFLFLGGFVLAIAMERWRLHKRLALLLVIAVGGEPRRQLAAFMLTTALISMWVSNTATALMMLPIALSVIAHRPGEDEDESRRYASALLLGVAFAASIGGMATLVGTPPNALLAAFLRETYGIEIGFAQWMMIGLPVALLMLALAFTWLACGRFRAGAAATHGELRAELLALGPMGRGERITAAVFLATAVAWVTQPLLGSFIPAWTDTSIALTAALALFLLPIGGPERRGVLTWDEAESKLPWGVLLLFGGGLSLAAAINESGLAEWIARALGPLGARSSIALIAAFVAAVILLSEVTTNTAAAASVLPLAAAMAGSEHLSPLAYAAPAVLAASCGFMLPVATPPNTIVYATGRVSIRDMMRAGCALDVFGLAVVTAVGAVLVASAPPG